MEWKYLKSLRGRQWLLIIIALLGSLIFIFSVALTSGPTETPLEKDINAYLSAARPDESDPNIQSLAELGPPAVPYLARTALWKPGLQEKLTGLVWRHDLLQPLRSRFPDLEAIDQKSRNQRVAVIALGNMGATAQSALPALRQVARHELWTERMYALYSIRKIGPEQSDLVIFLRALNDTERFCRVQGALGLGKLGRLARGGIPELNRMLSDSEESVRRAAKEALSQIDADLGRTL